MKNPFESKVFNNCLLAASMVLSMYLAAQEKEISFFGIVFLGVVGGIMIYLVIQSPYLIYKEIRRRVDNGIDLFANLETKPEVVKARMLHIMHYGHTEGIKGALKEFNDIFRNYPEWKLENWEVFRAWYKDFIDNSVLKYPDVYNARFKETGEPYTPEKDPLYDPNAPDWSEFDLPKSDYDEEDDDDYDDDDLDDYDDSNGGGNNDGLFNSKSEAFGFGIGIGLMGGSIGSASSGG